MPKQLEFNFDTTSVQLELPFAQSPSANQEDTERYKQELASWALSQRDTLETRAKLETSKQRPLDPNASANV